MLALRRTDERLAIGKRIHLFPFATLLWPQVRLRWQHNEEVRGLPRLAALHDAAVEVLETESHSLAIQRRFRATCMTCGFCRRVLKDVQASLPILLSIIRATARATIFCFARADGRGA